MNRDAWIKNNLVVRPTTAWIITNHQLRLMFKEVSDLYLRVRYPEDGFRSLKSLGHPNVSFSAVRGNDPCNTWLRSLS